MKRLFVIIMLLVLPFGLVQLPFVQRAIFEKISTHLQKNHSISVKAENLGGFWPFTLNAKKLSFILSNQSKIDCHKINLSLAKKALLRGIFSLSLVDVDKVVVDLKPSSEKFELLTIFKSVFYAFKYINQQALRYVNINHLNLQNCDFKVGFKHSSKGINLSVNPLNLEEKVTFKIFEKDDNKVIDFAYDSNNCLNSYLKNFITSSELQEYIDALKTVSGSVYFKEQDCATGNVDAAFDSGSMNFNFRWHEKDGITLDAKNSTDFFFPEVGQIQSFSFDGMLGQELRIKKLELISDNLKVHFKTDAEFSKSLWDLSYQDFYDHLLKANLDIDASGDLIEDYLHMSALKTSLNAVRNDKGLAISMHLPEGVVSNTVLREFLQPKTTIDALYNKQSICISIPLLWGDLLTFKANSTSASLNFKKRNKRSLFEDSVISASFQKDKWVVKGKIKPVGDNISTMDLLFDRGTISGNIFVNLSDMAPLTAPFDFATVGIIKGDILFNKFSFFTHAGSVNVDLQSKFFRSPIFKTELVALKGSYQDAGKANLMLDVNMLAIGKAFLSEKGFISLTGDAKGYDLDIQAKSHKIGYLSSPLKIDVKAKIDPVKSEVNLNFFEIQHLKQSVKMEKPTKLTHKSLTDTAFLINDGRIDIKNMRFDRAWHGDITFKSVPIGILNWFLYKTILVGIIEGDVTLFGNQQTPDFKGDFKAKKVQWGQLNAFSEGIEALLDIDLHAIKKGDDISLKSTIKGKNVADLALEILFNSANQSKPLQGQLKGFLDLSLISAIVASGDRLSGRILCDLGLHGTRLLPGLSGYLKTENAYVELAEFGTVINKIKGTVKASGTRLVIESLIATDDPLYQASNRPKKGDLQLTGSIDFKKILEPAVDMNLMVKNFLLVNSDSIVGTADGNLKIKGEGIYAVISGVADIHSLDIDIDALDTDDDIPMIKVKDPKKRTFAKEYQKSLHLDKDERMILPLDLILKTNGKLSVHGSIVSESIWGGEMGVKGPINKPFLEGNVNLISGTLDFFGKNLKIEKGSVLFALDKRNDALLAMQATKNVSDITIKVIIDTSRDEPIEFKSSPAYKKDEILSLLLFGRAAGTVSAGQSIQLASALAKLNGKKGFNLMDDLRKGFGIDTFEIKEQTTINPLAPNAQASQAVRIGKKLTESTEISVEQGAGDSRLGLEMEITDNLSFEADIAAQKGSKPTNTSSGSSAGIVWSKRY